MKGISKFIVCSVCIVLGVGCASTAPQSTETGESPSAPGVKASEPQTGEMPVESDKELKNTLKWTTASEVENFGFDIYRSTSEDGDFERMTAEPLPGAGTVDEPQSYVWHDTTIEPGVDYYYYIESISMSGVRERFSPVIKSPAKY